MILSKIKAGDYYKIKLNSKYCIVKINGFVKDIIANNSKIQITSIHPKNKIFSNTTLSYASFLELNPVKVNWNTSDSLMKLLY